MVRKRKREIERERGEMSKIERERERKREGEREKRDSINRCHLKSKLSGKKTESDAVLRLRGN